MVTTKKILGFTLATAAATAFLIAPLTAHADQNEKAYLCYGANNCKGQSACKTTENSCKGLNACQSQGSTMVSSESECTEEDGKLLMD